MSIRLRILLLVLCVALTSLAAAGWAVLSTYAREKQAMEQALRETARALSLVVDRELGRREAVAWTLATSPSLRAGDWLAFHAQAVEATAAIGGWVVLFGPDGMLANTSQPADAALPKRREERRYVRTTASGATISDLFQGPATGKWLVALSVPLKQPGMAGHGISIVVLPEHLQQVIDDQKLPLGWTAAVVDRQGRVVARHPEPQKWVGRASTPDLAAWLGAGTEGFLHSPAPDGEPSTSFFDTSPNYQWAFIITVPDAQLGATLRQSVFEASAVAFALLAVSAAAALVVGRKITVPARRLQAAAEALKAGETIVYTSAGITELDVAGATLAQAGTRLIEANHALERREHERQQAEQRMAAQLARMELLDQITRAIGDRLDLHSVFRVVANSVAQQLQVAFCAIALADNDAGGDRLHIDAVGAGSEALAARLGLGEQAKLAVDADGLSRCMGGELVHEPDLALLHAPLAQRLAAAGLRSAVFAPLQLEGRVFGLILVARSAAHAFSSGDCEFMRQLSEHAALAAQQARLHGALQAAYDELRQTQQIVLQQERLRAIGEMASGIAHDFNNAISPVALYTESLLESEAGLSTRGRGQLEMIQRAIEDVAKTVARLGEFYRPRDAQAERVAVDLDALARQVVELTRPRWRDMAQQAGIAIGVETDLQASQAPVLAAEGEIREALTNLAFNAVDAMPAGGTLTLSTRRVDDADGSAWVQLEVGDNGIGMDEEARRRCLEPFFTTKGQRGSGLGLAMVYGTVQRHGGQIRIDSAPGEGTRIRLRFQPAGALPRPDSGWGLLAPAAAAAADLRLHVLLVDDDAVLARTLTEILQAEGHRVTAAAGGEQGIEAFAGALARNDPFDVVITDLGMPRVDGRQVAQAVKAAAPATPVLMLTGWGRRMNEDGERPPHVDQLLSKPPRLAELRAALARAGAR